MALGRQLFVCFGSPPPPRDQLTPPTCRPTPGVARPEGRPKCQEQPRSSCVSGEASRFCTRLHDKQPRCGLPTGTAQGRPSLQGLLDSDILPWCVIPPPLRPASGPDCGLLAAFHSPAPRRLPSPVPFVPSPLARKRAKASVFQQEQPHGRDLRSCSESARTGPIDARFAAGCPARSAMVGRIGSHPTDARPAGPTNQALPQPGAFSSRDLNRAKVGRVGSHPAGARPAGPTMTPGLPRQALCLSACGWGTR